jgi:activator of HSP90 ATPase
MRSVIRQSLTLPAPADALFDMYLDPAAHGAFTGSPVTIGADPGAEFRAFEGQLSGTILVVVRRQLIIQSWRSTKFGESDPDSTLILMFSPEVADESPGRLDLVHLDVPRDDYDGVTAGWEKYYWTPWRSYLEGQKG